MGTVPLALEVRVPATRAAESSVRILNAKPITMESGAWFETHVVEGVPVKIFGIAKTIADCFRYRNKIGLSVAIEGLQETLRQRRATPGEIADQAEQSSTPSVIIPKRGRMVSS